MHGVVVCDGVLRVRDLDLGLHPGVDHFDFDRADAEGIAVFERLLKQLGKPNPTIGRDGEKVSALWLADTNIGAGVRMSPTIEQANLRTVGEEDSLFSNIEDSLSNLSNFRLHEKTP